MSKAVNNLRKLEKRSYANWSQAVRQVHEHRSRMQDATPNDRPERRAIMEMSAIAADQAFRHWQQICETLDEIELQNHREPTGPLHRFIDRESA